MASSTGGPDAVWAFVENEHRDLVRAINRIHEVACEIGRGTTPELPVHILELLRWFDTALDPHMAWEETVLFPVIDQRAGTPWATRATRFDHQQMRDVAAKLRAGLHDMGQHAGGDPQAEVRCRLFSLEALLRAHVEREERFLIPLLSDDHRVPPAEMVAASEEGAGFRPPLT